MVVDVTVESKAEVGEVEDGPVQDGVEERPTRPIRSRPRLLLLLKFSIYSPVLHRSQLVSRLNRCKNF